MDYLPIFVDLRGAECLVVGGGEVASRKVRSLLAAGASIRIVAPGLGPELRDLAAGRRVSHAARPFVPADVDGARLAIAATDAPGTNADVARAASERGVLVNVVDAPDLCTFILPSVLDRSPLVAAVSSGGAAPVLARLARSRMEAVLPESLGPLARLAAELRGEVRRRVGNPRGRRRFWEAALSGPAASLAAEGRLDEARAMLRDALAAPAHDTFGARIDVVELRTGDPQLLSVAAIRSLQSADAIAAGPGIDEDVLTYGRRDAARLRIEADSCIGDERLEEALAVRLERGDYVVVVTRDAEPIESRLATLGRTARIPTAG